MNADRRTAITVGVLFIIGTAAGVMSGLLTMPIMDVPEYLTLLAQNEIQLVAGAICVLVMGFSLAMIPAMLFPIFKKSHESLAVGAVIFRGVLEGVTYIAIVIIWMVLLTLSREYGAATAAEATQYEAFGMLLQESLVWINQMLALVFSIGALMIYTVFYQTRLIPRWLSLWGLIGGVLYVAVPVLGMFGSDLGFLMIPLAVQEMIMALWLIVKGFTVRAAETKIADTEPILRTQYS